MSSLTSRFCRRCNKNVVAIKDEPNHFIHFVLTIITGGLWAPIWFLNAIRIRSWKCTECGSIVS